MTKDYITFTETITIDRTSTATLNDSYLAMKQTVINHIKNAVLGWGTGFTPYNETTPTASGTQTIDVNFNTPFAINAVENYIYNVQLVFTILTSGNLNIAITLTSRFMRGNVGMNLHTAATNIATSIANPTEVRIDVKSVLITTPDCFAVGIQRANFLPVAIASVFPTAGYSLFKYKMLHDESVLWGGISNSVTNQPIQTITSAVSSIGFSMQVQYGYMRTTTSAHQLMSMGEVYFNETASISAALVASVSSNDQMLIVTMPEPQFTQGTIVRVGEDDYYVFCRIMYKAALGKITA